MTDNVGPKESRFEAKTPKRSVLQTISNARMKTQLAAPQRRLPGRFSTGMAR